MADYISKIQTPDGTDYSLKASALPYGVTSGDGSAYTVTVSPDVALVDGTAIVVKFNATSTVANPTINVNNLGVKTIYGQYGTIPQGSIQNTSVYILIYDSVNEYWRMQSNDRIWIGKITDNLNLPVVTLHSVPGSATYRLNTARYTEDLRVNPSKHSVMASDNSTTRTAVYAFASGNATEATGSLAHTEGYGTKATSTNTHAEGQETRATTRAAHSEGMNTVAAGEASHTEGRYTQTQNHGEHAEGSYNKSHQGSTTAGFGTDGTNTIHSIGIGTDENARKNAVEVMQNGDMYIKGIGSYDGIHIKNETGAPAGTTTLQETIADTVTTEQIQTVSDFDLEITSAIPIIDKTQDSATSFAIEPNKLYMFGERTTLDITFVAGPSGIVNEYLFQFDSGSTVTTLSLPNTVTWVTLPSIVANKTYLASIVNNLGVMGIW